MLIYIKGIWGYEMEWQQIIGFYQVAKLKSFTRAAEATLRTQSALTQQIKALEKEFDCLLLERIGKRKVIVTPIGERFFKFAGSLLIGYNQLREDIAEHREFKKGHLRIAAPFTTFYHLLPLIIREYHKKFPWVELSLIDRPQKEVVDLVKIGDVDIGMALESSVTSALRKRRWKMMEPGLLVPAGHPLSGRKKISVAEIAQTPLILPPERSDAFQRSNLETLFRKHNVRYSVIMESSNIELSSLYVEMGLGVSFASLVKDLAPLQKRKLSFISLRHILPVEHLCIIMRKDKKMTVYQNSFLDLLFFAHSKKGFNKKAKARLIVKGNKRDGSLS